MDERRPYTDADIERQLTAAGQQLSTLPFADVVPAAMRQIRALPRNAAATSATEPPDRPPRRSDAMQPLIPHRTRRSELLRVALAACAVFLVGATLTVLTNRPESQTGQPDEPTEPAPFEIPGYRYAGSVDLSPYGAGGRPPFPQGVAFANNELIVVGEGGTMRALALTREGSLVYEHQIADPPNPADLDAMYASSGDWTSVAQGFGNTIDISAGSDGSVFVTSRLAADSITEIDSNGQVVAAWNPPVNLEAGLISANFVTADRMGNIYYGEEDGCSVGKIRPDGMVDALVSPENGSCVMQPYDLLVVEDRLFVASVQVEGGLVLPILGLSGQRLSDLVVTGLPEHMWNTAVLPVRIAIDHNGNLILIVVSLRQTEGQPSTTDYNLLTVSQTGELLSATILPPAELWIDIAVAPDGTLAILYRDSTEVLLFEPDDSAPSVPATESPAADAPFELPGFAFGGSIDLAPYGSGEVPIFAQGLALGADGAVYVGDAATMRLLALDRQGSLLVESQLDPAPDEEDMAQLFDLYERVGRDWGRVANVYAGRITLGTGGEFIYRSTIGNRIQQVTSDGQIVAGWTIPIVFDAGVIGIEFFAVGQDGTVVYASRGDCGVGLLHPDGSAAPLATLPDCPPNTPMSIALHEGRVYVPRPSSDMPGDIEILAYDLQGRLVEILSVRGPDTPTDEPGLWFPMATNVDADGNLVLLVTTIIGRDADDRPLMSTHLMTVDATGAVLNSTEIPSAYQLIDLAVAPDGTLGILYRDSAEVLLYVPVS